MARFDAVLIGASAGGIDALGKILPALPVDLPATVFIAQHAEARTRPMLINVLQKSCKLQIRYPMDEEFYMSGIVYVAPPGNHMLLTYQKVWIFPANFVYLPKPCIDLMFQSAANEFREKAIGVLLSGRGNDGAIGIKAIKERGGTTIVQSEGSSKYPDMPKAAIATNAVDYQLPVDEIGPAIARLVYGNGPV